MVDDADQVIGREKRKIVHAHGLKHRAVHILIVNKAGAVFLQRRSPRKDTFPNCWDSSCSGHVDTGEDYETAAIRELNEELGLTGFKPNFLEPLFKIKARPETGQEFIQVYRGLREGPFKLNPLEITEGKFFSLGEIDLLLKKSPGECASALVYLWPIYRKL